LNKAKKPLGQKSSLDYYAFTYCLTGLYYLFEYIGRSRYTFYVNLDNSSIKRVSHR